MKETMSKNPANFIGMIVKSFLAFFFIFLAGGLTSAQENYKPVPVIEVQNGVVQIGETMFFDGTASYDPDGSIMLYRWDFGDGQTAQGSTTSHIFSQANAYLITFTVWDNREYSSQATTTVFVNAPNQPPSVVIEGETKASVQQIIRLKAKAQDPEGDKLKYDWEINDQNNCALFQNEDLLSCDIACSKAGEYKATVYVEDEKGGGAVKTVILEIMPLPSGPEGTLPGATPGTTTPPSGGVLPPSQEKPPSGGGELPSPQQSPSVGQIPSNGQGGESTGLSGQTGEGQGQPASSLLEKKSSGVAGSEKEKAGTAKPDWFRIGSDIFLWLAAGVLLAGFSTFVFQKFKAKQPVSQTFSEPGREKAGARVVSEGPCSEILKRAAELL